MVDTVLVLSGKKIPIILFIVKTYINFVEKLVYQKH